MGNRIIDSAGESGTLRRLVESATFDSGDSEISGFFWLIDEFLIRPARVLTATATDGLLCDRVGVGCKAVAENQGMSGRFPKLTMN